MNSTDILQSFLHCAREAADPRAALRPHLVRLKSEKSLALLAFGKASLEMADEALISLSPRFVRGVVACVPERLESLASEQRARFEEGKIELLSADHPLPTQRNLAAAESVRDFVASLKPSDHLVVLISGGGSAHLTLPAPELTLDQLRNVTKLVQRAGLDIRQLNAVRKHCEQLKGGRLARMCTAKCVDAFVLSDVLGDLLDVISSGPFAPDPSTFAEALDIVLRVGGREKAPEIADYLGRGAAGDLEETPKPGEPAFRAVSNTLIASNRRLVDAMAEHAEQLKIPVASKWYEVSGDSAALAKRIEEFIQSQPPSDVQRALIVGGEWTVDAGSSDGKGGPSQELALALATKFAHADPSASHFGAMVYSSDGIDGPTDAAGAIVDGSTFHAGKSANLDAHGALRNHDSHSYFSAHPHAGRVHLRTGASGTNINHVAVVLFRSGN